MTRIEWTYTAKTSRLLHALALAAFGAIGSLFVVGAALVAFVVAGSLLAGEVAVLAVLAAVAVLFARRLAPTLVLARRERGLREYFSACSSSGSARPSADRGVEARGLNTSRASIPPSDRRWDHQPRFPQSPRFVSDPPATARLRRER